MCWIGFESFRIAGGHWRYQLPFARSLMETLDRGDNVGGTCCDVSFRLRCSHSRVCLILEPNTITNNALLILFIETKIILYKEFSWNNLRIYFVHILLCRRGWGRDLPIVKFAMSIRINSKVWEKWLATFIFNDKIKYNDVEIPQKCLCNVRWYLAWLSIP